MKKCDFFFFGACVPKGVCTINFLYCRKKREGGVGEMRGGRRGGQ